VFAAPSHGAARGAEVEGEAQRRLVFAVRKDGSELPIEISAAELGDGDRQIRVSAIRDVTERTRLEREIVEVGEQERRRIGRDLHDGLGQMLTGISLNLSSLSQKLGQLAPELIPEVQAVTRNVQSTIADVKHVAKQLSPNVVSDGGLVQALKRLVTELDRRSDMRCTARIDGACDIDDETAATHVYRIAQEALNNALIHSNAETIELRCRSHGATIELEILDDGIGIAPAMHRVEGSGIRNMRYRAHSLSGTLDIVRRPDRGTIVSCKFVRDSAERGEPGRR
jgi:two-component system, LuxR family, sensor kinase FixL